MKAFALTAVLCFAVVEGKGGYGSYGSSGHHGSSGYPGCTDFFVPITVDTVSYPLQFPPFKNQYEATEFSLRITSRSAADMGSVLGSPKKIKETFKISTRYCPPTKGYGNSNDILLATHGIGFDKSYWSFDYPAGNPNNYSFTYSANNAGYGTLTYDRIGTGLSSKPDPYNIVQAQVELAVLQQLTRLLRNGQLKHGVPKPDKVIHVGHSFGSSLSNGLAASTPSLSDGLVLTGYSNVNQYMSQFVISTVFHIASLADPSRFKDRSSGYLTWGDQYYNQYSFLYWPYFNPGALAQDEATKQPFAIGELTTTQTTVPVVAPGFKKPVLYLASSNDLIFCGANCTQSFLDGPAKKTFPVADLEIYIQPNVGHALNLHYNATGAYNVAFSFLKEHGLY